MKTITKTPLIITDKNGVIISFNEAAHNACAAVSVGSSVLELLDRNGCDEYKRAATEGLMSFSIKAPALNGAELIFDMTKARSDGIARVHIAKRDTYTSESISYRELADEFSRAVADKQASKRRFTELYETLAPSFSAFGASRHISELTLRDVLDPFYDQILPRLLAVYGTTVTQEIAVTDESVIYAEPYGLYLCLSAMLTAAASVSPDGGASLRTEDKGDRIIFEAAAAVDGAREHHSPRRMYGVHYVDVIFAQSVACASGYTFFHIRERSPDRVRLTLSVPCRDSYPAYLKARSEMARGAAVAASLFPFSTKEEDCEHQ